MDNIVSFINMKGGVGKTTLCINIAYTLTKHFKKKVLIVDIDPQFNATQSLFTKFKSFDEYEELQKKHKTINYILQPPSGGIAHAPAEYKTKDLIQNLLISGDGKLDLIAGDLEIVSFEASRRGSERILSDFLIEQLSKDGFQYDYILIDTPATYSIYSQSALIASDYYVVPISPDVFAGLGYSLLKRVMSDDIALKGKKISQLGVIFTLYKEGRVGRQSIVNDFEAEGIFSNTLHENERIKTGKIQTFIYDMKGTQDDIINITNEFIEKIDLDKVKGE